VLQRPRIEVVIRQTGWAFWPLFKPHHYLADAGPMPFGTAFVGFVDETPVVHLGMSTKWIGSGASGRVEARACRMVVMPEWQGAGVGMRFLNALCERELQGVGMANRKTTTLFHTNHPALTAALRRDGHWRQISQMLHGGANKPRNGMKWGGHLRGVQGYRFYGEEGVRQARLATQASGG
jgi:GNAT superfamily N-acetyltransferase